MLHKTSEVGKVGVLCASNGSCMW